MKNMKKIYLIISLACLTLVSCEQNKSNGSIQGHEYVDLGLPSGLKWATCNVGANSPEEYGDYYAWGETKTKEKYTEKNCATLDVDMDDISGKSRYDVARKKWGESWRMPTYTEMNELRYHCTWEWTTQNNVEGYKVTGPNGNSIFLPAAGYREGSSLEYAGEEGYYWNSSPYSSDTFYSGGSLQFCSSSHSVNLNYDRIFGFTVRPIKD